MSNFKLKNLKKVLVKNNESLDSKHDTFLKEFYNEQNILLPKLIDSRLKLSDKFKSKSISFDEKLDIKSKIKDIDAKINKIKTNKKEYLLNNSQYIFQYFEDKKNISEGNNKPKLLDEFFNIKDNSNNENSKVSMSNIQKYLSNVDINYLDINNFINPINICKSCNDGELIRIEHEGIMVCNKCGINVKFLIDNDKPTYKEPPKEVCFYAYKRINHFREILAQFQAKETTLIPDDIIENIKLQIKKERLDIKSLNNKDMKELLKKLKYNKYYEHIPHLINVLSGIKAPTLDRSSEEMLRSLFKEIQIPFMKNCPPTRKNFLSYSYVLHKFCELLEYDHLLPYFTLLKSREKLQQQDKIWKKICNDLKWEYIPSI